MTFLNRFKNYLRCHAFQILTAMFAVGLVGTCIVLPRSYIHWSDDVMINEFGRFPIGPHQWDWNMNWYPLEVRNQQTASPYYLGGALLEIGYRLMGETGPRTLVFSAFVLSTFLLFFYLRRKTQSRSMAALLSLLYFSYPMMAVFVRDARIEAFVFLFIIAALWLLRYNPVSTFGRICLFGVVGALCAVAGFIWISAFLLAPLVLWEMVEWFRHNKVTVGHGAVLVCVAACGAIIMGAILFSPFYSVLSETGTALVAGFSSATSDQVVKGSMFKEFLRLVFGFPGFFALGLAALFLCRRLWLLAALSCLTLGYCISTNFYNSRMIYYLPIAIVGAAVFWTECKARSMRKFILLLLIAVTGLSYGRTCVLRSVTDWYARPARDYVALRNCMEQALGRDCRVYNHSYALYYVGRDLGWKQFRANGWNPIPPEELYPLFDHYVCSEDDVKPELEKSLFEHGFKCRGTFYDQSTCPKSRLGAALYKTKRMSPVLGAFRIYDR